LSSGSDKSAGSGRSKVSADATLESDNAFEEGTPKSTDFVDRVKSAVVAAVSAVTTIGTSRPAKNAPLGTATVPEEDEETTVTEKRAPSVSKQASEVHDDHDYELELEDDAVEGGHRAVISPNNFAKDQAKRDKAKEQPLQQAQSAPLPKPTPVKRPSAFKREPEYESSMTLDVPGLHADEEGDDEMEMEFASASSRRADSVSASESEYSVSAGEEEQELDPPQPP